MITGPGGKPKWRLHATYDPAAGRFTGLELTDERGAESFDRTAWRPGDVALGDRGYARPPALRRILAAGADFIVRTGWTRLRLLDGRGRGAAGLGADLRLPRGRRGRRAGGRGGLLRPGRQVAWRRRVPGAPRRPPPRAGGGGAGGQGAAPAAEPVPLAPAAAAADRAGHRLPDADHLAARGSVRGRGAGGVPLALAGGTRVQAAQEPAGPGPAAGQERGPGPQLAARPPHPGLADRGQRQDAPGASPRAAGSAPTLHLTLARHTDAARRAPRRRAWRVERRSFARRSRHPRPPHPGATSPTPNEPVRRGAMPCAPLKLARMTQCVHPARRSCARPAAAARCSRPVPPRPGWHGPAPPRSRPGRPRTAPRRSGAAWPLSSP